MAVIVTSSTLQEAAEIRKASASRIDEDFAEHITIDSIVNDPAITFTVLNYGLTHCAQSVYKCLQEASESNLDLLRKTDAALRDYRVTPGHFLEVLAEKLSFENFKRIEIPSSLSQNDLFQEMRRMLESTQLDGSQLIEMAKKVSHLLDRLPYLSIPSDRFTNENDFVAEACKLIYRGYDRISQSEMNKLKSLVSDIFLDCLSEKIMRYDSLAFVAATPMLNDTPIGFLAKDSTFNPHQMYLGGSVVEYLVLDASQYAYHHFPSDSVQVNLAPWLESFNYLVELGLDKDKIAKQISDSYKESTEFSSLSNALWHKDPALLNALDEFGCFSLLGDTRLNQSYHFNENIKRDGLTDIAQRHISSWVRFGPPMSALIEFWNEISKLEDDLVTADGLDKFNTLIDKLSIAGAIEQSAPIDTVFDLKVSILNGPLFLYQKNADRITEDFLINHVATNGNYPDLLAFKAAGHNFYRIVNDYSSSLLDKLVSSCTSDPQVLQRYRMRDTLKLLMETANKNALPENFYWNIFTLPQVFNIALELDFDFSMTQNQGKECLEILSTWPDDTPLETLSTAFSLIAKNKINTDFTFESMTRKPGGGSYSSVARNFEEVILERFGSTAISALKKANLDTLHPEALAGRKRSLSI